MSKPPPPPRVHRPIVLDVHLVSHTHWDREWYLPAERFRQRLVALVDELLDAPAAARARAFCSTGRRSCSTTTSRVRPERVQRAGRIAARRPIGGGPLVRARRRADSERRGVGAQPPHRSAHARALRRGRAPGSLLSGLIRTSRRRCRRSPPDSAWTLVVLWRGYGSRRFPPGDAAWWRSPTGERVLLYHLRAERVRARFAIFPSMSIEAERRWVGDPRAARRRARRPVSCCC